MTLRMRRDEIPFNYGTRFLHETLAEKAMLLVAPNRMRPGLFAKFPRGRQVLELATEKRLGVRRCHPGKAAASPFIIPLELR